MGDSKLRELERKWKESGSTEDEAAYLLERVRVGDLEKSKLELAAYCNHEAARLALGDEAPEVPEDLEEWLIGIRAWGNQTAIETAIEVAAQVLPYWEARFPDDQRPRQAIEAGRAWCRCPCLDHADKAVRLAQEASQAGAEVAQQIEDQVGYEEARGNAGIGYAAFAAQTAVVTIHFVVQPADESKHRSLEKSLSACVRSVLATGISEERLRKDLNILVGTNAT